VGAPAILVVFEHEAPVRILGTASTDADQEALGRWVESGPFREAALALAFAAHDADGGAARQAAWQRLLRDEGGGIVGQVERLLVDLHAAEQLVRDNAGGTDGATPGVIERLRRRLRSLVGWG
jgi:hypothetical protein